MATLAGNDISVYQGDVNYDVYKNNTNFVIIKATEGVGFVDPKLSRNQSESRRVGLPLGYYHFARPDLGNSAIAEADHFLNRVGQLQEGEVLALDYEPANQSQNDVTWCKSWLDHVFSRTNCKPLIYMSESVIAKFDWSSVVNGGYGLWIARYVIPPTPDAPYNTGEWPFAAMYQWTSSQIVPGINGKVDGNRFYGDVTAFKKYGYKPIPVPPQIDYKKLYEAEQMKNGLLQTQLETANARINKFQTLLTLIANEATKGVSEI